MTKSTLSVPAAQTGLPEHEAKRIVRLEGVTKRYPNCDEPAVASMNLSINEGEFFSILGSSGSGKTTTLRMIAGFEQPTTGRVCLGGEDVTDLPPFRREVNTVFQNYALFPHMTVERNVAYPLKMMKVAKAEIDTRVAEALSKVSMGGFEARLPHQLSGGQKQRVALARALVGHPKLLLLDEPLGALDLKLRESMLVVLKHLQREVGITFVYVTHDQGEALAMSDRVAVMSSGRIEQIGTPEDIYSRPRTAFVAGFIGKTNLLACTRTGERQGQCGDLPISLSEAAPGDAFQVSVRPEDIVLGAAADQADNHYDAVVAEVIYFGHEQEVVLDARGQRLVSRVRGSAGVVPGARVRVGWQASSGVALEGTRTA